MSDESDFSHPGRPHRKRLSFDPTINAGHLLTFAGFLVSGFIAYSTLDRRVTVVETRTIMTDQRAQEKEARTNSALQEIKHDVKETNRTTNQIARDIAASRK